MLSSLPLVDRTIEASENLRGSTHIRGPQRGRPQVCHRNPPQPHNQTESHRSWWVTALLRQSVVGLSSETLKDFSNPPNSLFTLCIFHSLAGWLTVVTSVRLTSVRLAQQVETFYCLGCGTFFVVAQVDSTLTQKRNCCKNGVLERYRSTFLSAVGFFFSFHFLPHMMIRLLYCDKLLPCKQTVFSNTRFPRPRAPHPFSSRDSWFPCPPPTTTLNYRLIKQQQRIRLWEHTSMREPRAKQPRRLPHFQSVAQPNPCG